MDASQTPLPACSFRYSLVPEGIVIEVAPELRADIVARVANGLERPSQRLPALYLGKPFVADLSGPWGFDGNLHPYAVSAARHAWLAAWPKERGVQAQLRAAQVLAASVAVLARFIRQHVQLSGCVGDKAPLFLPDLMIPDEEGSAAIDAEFHRSAEAWIAPGPMRSLDDVRSLMCEVYAKLHPSLLAQCVPADYYAGVGRSHDVKLLLAIGNASGMATDPDRSASKGSPIQVAGYNVDYAAQQLTLLAALIKIAEMIERPLVGGMATETA